MSSHRDTWKKTAATKMVDPSHETDDLLRASQQAETNPREMLHAIQAPAQATPKTVLMLQRTYGNKATARMLAQTRTRAAPTATMQPEREGTFVIQREAVSKTQEELGPSGSVAYGWDYKYSVRFTPNRCILTIKAKAIASPHPDTGETPTAEDMEKLKADSAKQFASVWDNEFLLIETATQNKYSLRTELEFVDSGEDLAVAVYKGTGRDDLSNWYTGSDDGVTRAHELGHQLGLLDEYEDSNVKERKDSSAAGVHKDNSVMGNYFDEGVSQATVKLRHGAHVAKDIGDATGRTFSATQPSRFTMFFRKLFS